MENSKITESIKIGKTCLPARVVLPPMATGKAPDGKLTDGLCSYYEKRAENPYVGMIITEHSFITQQGKAHGNQVSAASDEMIPGMQMLAERIHALGNGTKLLMQISHAGGETKTEWTGYEEAVGPSDAENKGQKVRALKKDEILEIEELFVAAALRAKKAGLDGVEIHGAHGYLLSQFYSPLTNHRTDCYGSGSVEDRIRFGAEVVQKVRMAVGDSFLISYRIGALDQGSGGSTQQDCVEACEILEKAGADLVHLSGGIGGYQCHAKNGVGYFRDASRAVREKVSIPVLMTGGVKTMKDANRLLEEGYADLIGIGRGLLKNPELAE